jgi:hypothetical protein
MTHCSACDEFDRLPPLLHNDSNWQAMHHRLLERTTAEREAFHEGQDAALGHLVRVKSCLAGFIGAWDSVASVRRKDGKPLSPFFFGQKLRRIVRERIEPARELLREIG